MRVRTQSGRTLRQTCPTNNVNWLVSQRANSLVHSESLRASKRLRFAPENWRDSRRAKAYPGIRLFRKRSVPNPRTLAWTHSPVIYSDAEAEVIRNRNGHRIENDGDRLSKKSSRKTARDLGTAQGSRSLGD